MSRPYHHSSYRDILKECSPRKLCSWDSDSEKHELIRALVEDDIKNRKAEHAQERLTRTKDPTGQLELTRIESDFRFRKDNIDAITLSEEEYLRARLNEMPQIRAAHHNANVMKRDRDMGGLMERIKRYQLGDASKHNDAPTHKPTPTSQSRANGCMQDEAPSTKKRRLYQGKSKTPVARTLFQESEGVGSTSADQSPDREDRTLFVSPGPEQMVAPPSVDTDYSDGLDSLFGEKNPDDIEEEDGEYEPKLEDYQSNTQDVETANHTTPHQSCRRTSSSSTSSLIDFNKIRRQKANQDTSPRLEPENPVPSEFGLH